jgi:hypothetical protein
MDVLHIFLIHPRYIYYLVALICLMVSGVAIHRRSWFAFTGWLVGFSLTTNILFLFQFN